MEHSTPGSEVLPIDRLRATQIVAAQVTADREMFAVALDATVNDDRDFSVVNVIRALSEDLAGALIDIHGDNAATLVRVALAQQLAAIDT